MMRSLLIACLMLGMASMAYAELQNVEVGGSIRIRGNYYEFDSSSTFGDATWAEQRTRLSVKADFTDDVTAFIELDSYDNWGEDFRSPAYLTGVDGRAASVDDVELYQGYIEANEMWGTPIRLRIGRQEMMLGSEWLIGNNDTAAVFQGLSYDGIRATYATDMVSVDVFWAKLAETFSDITDDDIELYGVYGSYLGLEDVVIDLYWLFVRDDIPTIGDADATTDLHTIGLRGAGTIGAFDFEAEVAKQFGQIEDRSTFLWWTEDVDFEGWGVNLEVGYTFDVTTTPRVYLGFAWLEGADNDNNGDDELGFNRLWSDWEYTEFLSNTDMSNVFVYRGGLSLMPTETVELLLAVTYFQADEVEDCGCLWWHHDADDEIGWEVGLYADYNYSEDLVFRIGYAHFFGGDGLEDCGGQYIILNGLDPFTGDDDDDYDYFFFETELSF